MYLVEAYILILKIKEANQILNTINVAQMLNSDKQYQDVCRNTNNDNNTIFMQEINN